MKGKGFPIVTAILLLLVFGVVVIILGAKAGAVFEIRSWGQNDTRIEDMSRDRMWESAQSLDSEEKWSFETKWSFYESEAEIEPKECIPSKYSGIAISEEEHELLAKIVYLEARGECAEGQQAVVEVIFNRVLDTRFPNSVGEVIYAPGQFCTVPMLDSAYPNEMQYAAIDAAMCSDGIVGDAIYFATRPLTKNCVRQIGCHYFCQ